MHNKILQANDQQSFLFFVATGILTALVGCRGKSGKNGTNGITGGATITAASCSTTDPNNATLNISITNTTTETLILSEYTAAGNVPVTCSIFNSLGFVSFCTGPVLSEGVPVTMPLPIGTTTVSLSCTDVSNACTSITGFACEGRAYVSPNTTTKNTTPGLAFQLDNIFGTVP